MGRSTYTRHILQGRSGRTRRRTGAMLALISRGYGLSYPIIDIGCGIKCFLPFKPLCKNLSNIPVLPTYQKLTSIKKNENSRSPYSFSRTASDTVCLKHRWSLDNNLCIAVANYFGSQGTYPLEMPWTSLITTSKLEKSKTVQASKPTSRRTRAHSKKA
jgi:hypothetical protein